MPISLHNLLLVNPGSILDFDFLPDLTVDPLLMRRLTPRRDEGHCLVAPSQGDAGFH